MELLQVVPSGPGEQGEAGAGAGCLERGCEFPCDQKWGERHRQYMQQDAPGLDPCDVQKAGPDGGGYNSSFQLGDFVYPDSF